MILVQYNDNYADEFDITGHFVTTNENVEEFKNKALLLKKEITYCFGTNQEIEYLSGKDILKFYSFKEISDEEADLLKKLKISKGFVGPFYNVLECEEDEKMEEDKEEFLYLIDNTYFKNDLFFNTVSVSNKEKNYTKREEHLKQNGYEKTYQGKYGATWEKIQKKELLRIL